MDGNDLAAGPVRDVHGRFAPGSGGRPPGARNRVSGRVARMILADFEAHQDELLPRLRRWFLPQYLALVGRLLPRGGVDDEGAGPDGLGEAELARLVGEAMALQRAEEGSGTGD
jgi:hypothetical protein